MDDIDEFEGYFGEEMMAEEGATEDEKKMPVTEFPWDVMTIRSDEGEKYEDEYREEKEGVEEEVLLSTTVSTLEKSEEEAPRPEESVHELPEEEVPAEVRINLRSLSFHPRYCYSSRPP